MKTFNEQLYTTVTEIEAICLRLTEDNVYGSDYFDQLKPICKDIFANFYYENGRNGIKTLIETLCKMGDDGKVASSVEEDGAKVTLASFYDTEIFLGVCSVADERVTLFSDSDLDSHILQLEVEAYDNQSYINFVNNGYVKTYDEIINMIIDDSAREKLNYTEEPIQKDKKKVEEKNMNTTETIKEVKIVKGLNKDHALYNIAEDILNLVPGDHDGLSMICNDIKDKVSKHGESLDLIFRMRMFQTFTRIVTVNLGLDRVIEIMSLLYDNGFTQATPDLITDLTEDNISEQPQVETVIVDEQEEGAIVDVAYEDIKASKEHPVEDDSQEPETTVEVTEDSKVEDTVEEPKVEDTVEEPKVDEPKAEETVENNTLNYTTEPIEKVEPIAPVIGEEMTLDEFTKDLFPEEAPARFFDGGLDLDNVWFMPNNVAGGLASAEMIIPGTQVSGFVGRPEFYREDNTIAIHDQYYNELNSFAEATDSKTTSYALYNSISEQYYKTSIPVRDMIIGFEGYNEIIKLTDIKPGRINNAKCVDDILNTLRDTVDPNNVAIFNMYSEDLINRILCTFQYMDGEQFLALFKQVLMMLRNKIAIYNYEVQLSNGTAELKKITKRVLSDIMNFKGTDKSSAEKEYLNQNISLTAYNSGRKDKFKLFSQENGRSYYKNKDYVIVSFGTYIEQHLAR